MYFAVCWREFNRKNELVTRVREFKTKAAMESFVSRLDQRSNFYEIVGYSF